MLDLSGVFFVLYFCKKESAYHFFPTFRSCDVLDFLFLLSFRCHRPTRADRQWRVSDIAMLSENLSEVTLTRSVTATSSTCFHCEVQSHLTLQRIT